MAPPVTDAYRLDTVTEAADSRVAVPSEQDVDAVELTPAGSRTRGGPGRDFTDDERGRGYWKPYRERRAIT